MRSFVIEPDAQVELDEAVDYYEREREGLGLEFLIEIEQVLRRIETQPKFFTAVYARASNGVIRRELGERFPFIVLFIETDETRTVS